MFSSAFSCSQELIERVAHEIRKAGRADRVILGSPMNANIWRMCGEALPEALRILPNREVRHANSPRLLFQIK